jgi:hypothetical protein
MIFQTALSPALADTVLRSARCGVTKTLTNTNVGLPIKGGPVILSTGTAWNDGTYVGPAITATDITNNLFMGLAYDYPELRTNTAGRWQGETVGLVQVYGVVDGVVQILTDAQGAGSVLRPDVNHLVGVTGPHTIAATLTADGAEVPALGGFAVLLDAIDASTATSTGSYAVFLRCM